MSAGWVPSEASRHGFWMAVFSLGPHRLFPLYPSVSISPLIKTQAYWMEAHPNGLILTSLPLKTLYRNMLTL